MPRPLLGTEWQQPLLVPPPAPTRAGICPRTAPRKSTHTHRIVRVSLVVGTGTNRRSREVPHNGTKTGASRVQPLGADRSGRTGETIRAVLHRCKWPTRRVSLLRAATNSPGVSGCLARLNRGNLHERPERRRESGFRLGRSEYMKNRSFLEDMRSRWRANPYRAGRLHHPFQSTRPRDCRDQDFLARGPSARVR